MTDKVLLIGWPSADWKLILPMIDAGKLPHLGRLIDTGVISKVTSVQPKIAQAVWTTVATGKYAHDHHILGASEPKPDGRGVQPATSLGRAGKALWNILNQSGKTCQILGWPASHPAEPIDGAVISEFFPQPVVGGKKNEWPLISGSIHPEQLIASLAELRMHPGEITGVDLLPFVPTLAKLKSAQDPRLDDLARIIAHTVSLHAASTSLLATQPWDLHAVCLPGIDSISRAFMNYHPPRPEFISEEDFEMFRGVIEATYVFHDMLLGTVLQHAGDDTSVMLLSDQGFHSGDKRHDQPIDEPGAPPEINEVGVLVMNGPYFKQDTLIFGSSVLDIAPTLLHVFDVPVGRDMPGNVLVDAFNEIQQPQYIDSWDDENGDDGRHPAEKRFDPLAVDIPDSTAEAPEVQEQHEAARHAKNALRLQLAESYMSAAREGMAIPILEDLWAETPADSRFGYKLMLAHIAIGRPELAHDDLERMVTYKKKYCAQALRQWRELDAKEPDSLTSVERLRKAHLWKQSRTNLSGMAFLRAWILHAEGNSQGALDVLAMADESKVYNLMGLLKLKADCLYRMKYWEAAETEYRRMLDIQPDNADAYLGLAKIYFDKKQFPQAAEFAGDSIGLRYFNPIAHYIYGGAVFRCGEPQQAAAALKVAVEQHPHLQGAYQRLFALYSGPLLDQEQAEHYRLKMEDAKENTENFERRRREGLVEH